MEGTKIDVSQLSKEIALVLENYSEETEQKIKKAIDKKTLEIVRDLKSNPIIPARTGDYRKGFKVNRTETGGYKINRIYNKRYRLTHLLEKPHAIRNGKQGNRTYGESRSFPHWRQAQKAADEFEKEIIKELKR